MELSGEWVDKNVFFCASLICSEENVAVGCVRDIREGGQGGGLRVLWEMVMTPPRMVLISAQITLKYGWVGPAGHGVASNYVPDIVRHQGE